MPNHTTINVGIITGGTAGNILARECTLNWGYRTLPGDDPWEVQRRAEAYIAELLLPKMKAKHPDANITLKRRSFVPGLLPQENEEAAKLALQWTGGNRTYAVPYGTEAGIFRGHGIPTVICGPGDISQAHQPNEFVAKSQMDACDAFLGKLIRWAEIHVASRRRAPAVPRRQSACSAAPTPSPRKSSACPIRWCGARARSTS